MIRQLLSVYFSCHRWTLLLYYNQRKEKRVSTSFCNGTAKLVLRVGRGSGRRVCSLWDGPWLSSATSLPCWQDGPVPRMQVEFPNPFVVGG